MTNAWTMAESVLAGPDRVDEGRPVSAFTVDVEDYYHVEAFSDVVRRRDWEKLEVRILVATERLLDLLARHRVRATFFVLGWVAERWPRLVTDCQRAGHELAVHGYDHRPVTAQSATEFREDVRRAKGIIEDVSGSAVLGYRAPTYSVVQETLWALDVLLEEGFRYDSSIFPIVHDRYGIPGAPRFPWIAVRSDGRSLIEFPISTVRLAGRNLPFVGGGYLRHFPPAFVRWGMRRVVERENRPAVVYVHPWELDPEQPRLPASRLTRWRHYRNLHRVEGRLDGLLQEFPFAPMREVLGL